MKTFQMIWSWLHRETMKNWDNLRPCLQQDQAKKKEFHRELVAIPAKT